MELTTSYQKLGEAYLGSSAGDLYIRIYAKYNSQSVTNNTSSVSYQSRLYFSGSYIISQGQTKVEMRGSNISNTTTTWQNFEGSQNGRFNNGETTVKTITTTITHNIDGTASINASAIFSSSGSWGWVGTATGSATLPSLHKPPTIQTAEMVETDANMISLGVPNTTIVQYLSKKTITLHATTEDDATPTYRLEHYTTGYNIPSSGYQASNVFNTDYTQNNIAISDTGKAKIIQRVKDSLNGETSDWLYIDINGTIQEPNGIAYLKPTIERTSTTIKRKSGGGVNLTDNKVSLNLKATIYKGNDVIGNNNLITQIGYKIWASDASEPANYTTLTPTIDSSGNITINNFEISNIEFTKVYNYKIIVADNYGYLDTITDGRVPIGVSLWTEYKDHVDFLALSIGNQRIEESLRTELFSGNDTSNSIPLSDDVDNYNTIVITMLTSNVYFTAICQAPFSKEEIATCWAGGNYIRGASFELSTNTLTFNWKRYGNLSNTGTETIAVIKVIGYK